jgi:hypothetical protein
VVAGRKEGAVRRFKVVARASIISYVEAESPDEAWQQGEERAKESITEYGFDREPGSVLELRCDDHEWSECEASVAR